MFFEITDFSMKDIEVFKLVRAPYRKPARHRPFHAISFRISGEARYETEDATITANTGDILFVPAFQPYIKDTMAERFYVVHFYSDDPIGNHLKQLRPSDPEPFRMLFEHMISVQTHKGPEYNHRIKQLCYQLIADIEKEYALQNATPTESAIKTAIDIIHERFTCPDLSVGELAKLSNMSETYFRRLFQKNTGVSPKQYVIQLKLELAKDLLRSGYYSITEVSDRCGFVSVYYFSAFLKRLTGLSPRDWISEYNMNFNRKIE